VILLADLVNDSHIAAFDLSDGHQVWKVGRLDGITGGFSTPGVITDAQGAPSIITVGAEGLLAYKPDTGDQVFSVPGVSNVPVTVPVVSGTSVYLCEPVGEIEPMGQYMKDPQDMDADDDGKLSLEEVKRSVAFYRMLKNMDERWGNKDGMVEEAEWNAAFGSMLDKGGLVAVQLPQPDVATPSVRWTYTKAVPYIASPLCYNDVLYIIRDSGVFMSVNPADGSEVKKDRLKKGGKVFYASPVAGDGKVYVVDRSGRATVLKAGAEWEELSSADFGEEIDATPAICDGLIYLRTPTKLYCFGA
jgi:outer membrane protein assembly factor BamB